MSTTTLSNILIIIGIIWIIAGYFTYMQTIKINRIMHELSPVAERLYSAKNAGFMRTRCIIFAAASNSGIIKEARILHTAFIIRPARVESFDLIKGQNIFNLNPGSFNVSETTKKALRNLVMDAANRRQQ